MKQIVTSYYLKIAGKFHYSLAFYTIYCGAVVHLEVAQLDDVLVVRQEPYHLRFRVLVFGFQVSVFGSWVSGLEFRVSGLGFRISGFGFRVSGFGFQVSGFRFRVSGFGSRV
jgi:hypothetical protein